MKSKIASSAVRFFLVAGLLFSPIATIADAPAPTHRQARYEINFLTDMIQHHAMAVMTSELCMDRAVHQELLTLCEQIKTTQMQEIELMQSWLLDWYGITFEPEMQKRGEKTMERLAALSGPEFEISFFEMMIQHHAKAVISGRQCVRKSSHAELIQVCESIVQTQSQEIALMESWLCQWYERCG